MTTEARLKLEINEAQSEIRLRERIATAPSPTVHKGLSLVYLVPKWSGTESAISLVEFFLSIEGSARGGQWLQADCLQVAVLGLVDNVRTFFNSCPELHGENVLWQTFETTFRDRQGTARRCYECQGIGHCQGMPRTEKRRGETKNSPGK
jgi:hypothetical protein